MLRNLPKVTQQRFKPGFLCDCKTVLLFVGGAQGGTECSRKRDLASLGPDRKDKVTTKTLETWGWGRTGLSEKTPVRVQT